jgi:MFS family permease
MSLAHAETIPAIEEPPQGAIVSGPPLVLPGAQRGRLLGYAALLMLLASFAQPYGGLIGIPVVFFLKNKLHLTAPQLAMFNLWTGVPLYFAFAFGLLRDRWSPMGTSDRGHLVLFGLLTAAIFAVIAFVNPTYGLMFVGVFLVTASIQTVLSSATGLFSEIGQAHSMPGQASAVLNVATNLPLLAGFMIGGLLSEVMEGKDAAQAARLLFLVGAGLMVATAAFGVLGPRALFTSHTEKREVSLLGDVKRLLKCGPVYPPLILLTLWNFAPAFGAALQYHMADALHASDAQVGAYYAIYWGCYIPSTLFYGWLCQRVPLSKILLWSTIVAVPQAVPLLLAHTPDQALIAALPMGLSGGVATAAYYDLAIRSCPKGLQGTMMMLVSTTAYFVALRFGDLWGTQLYDHKGGFAATVIATTVVYALMLPVLWFVPRRLSSTTDGEAFSN